jgi:hypothetical protein
MDTIKSSVKGDLGYAKLTFSPSDLEVLRALIREQWLGRIREVVPHHVARFEGLPLDRYHELAGLINHKTAWPKLKRILEQPAVDIIRKLPTFGKLEKEFGDFVISDEENLGRENIYWRLVRPDSPSDVGPMHADQWFWVLGHGATPEGVQRVKLWIAIYCEAGISGFRFVPGSHCHDWPYHGERRDGFVKPVIDVTDDQLDIQMFDSRPGDAIVFNDRLLHGGAVGGSRSRVSLEFTIFVKKDRYFQ